MLATVCPIVCVGSIAEAQEHASGPLTAAIIDVNLKDGSGWELLALVRKHHPLVPALMLTGSDFTNLAKRAYAVNAIGYEKPPEPDHLRRFAREALVAAQDKDVRLRRVVRVFAEESTLSQTEEDVIEAFTRGLDRGQLTDGRKIAISTHKTHVNRICEKTGHPSLHAVRELVLRRYFAR